MAADQNHAYAQYFLGIIYEIGRGVPKDHDEALRWIRKAAEQGFGEAQVLLGEFEADSSARLMDSSTLFGEN